MTNFEQQFFGAIEMLVEAKLKNIPLNTYIEATIINNIKNNDGTYNILYQDMVLKAQPLNALQTFEKDEIVFVLLLGQSLDDKKIILSSKTKGGNANVDLEQINNLINEYNRLKYGYNYLKNIISDNEFILNGLKIGEEEEYIILEIDKEKFLNDINKAEGLLLSFEVEGNLNIDDYCMKKDSNNKVIEYGDYGMLIKLKGVKA